MDDCGITDDHAVGGNIGINKCARADHDVVTDGDLADYDSVGPYPDIVPDDGSAFTLSTIGLSDGDTCCDIDVIAEGNVGMDNKSPEMSDIDTGAGLYFSGKCDLGPVHGTVKPKTVPFA